MHGLWNFRLEKPLSVQRLMNCGNLENDESSADGGAGLVMFEGSLESLKYSKAVHIAQ